MKSNLPDDVLRALTEADRAPGWNNRQRTIRRFDLFGDLGHTCTLYVVPYRRFAYGRQERMAAHNWHAQGKPQGTAA